MKLGNLKIFIIGFIFIFTNQTSLLAEDKIETVPLINLEELSPTFEEEKDELEKIEEKSTELNKIEDSSEEYKKKK